MDSPVDPELRMRRVDPDADVALRKLHERRFRLVLGSNTKKGQNRRQALEQAGILQLFAVTLQSDALGVAKPSRLFYDLAVTAAQFLPHEIVWVGNNIRHDVIGPFMHGMQSVLVRPAPLSEQEVQALPPGVPVIPHLSSLLPMLPGSRLNGR
ncbi:MULTISPECIES: HAD family hydrolase [unclassified Streptosporangium]|uniref:HAD family hydrolase n=1 Tax=unclassified Streptosporangium TaxID=2632669 RepID=UPI002E2DB7B9|nr:MULTISPECIES: HAD family hydrolase [unclassified Streptosporangium]